MAEGGLNLGIVGASLLSRDVDGDGDGDDMEMGMESMVLQPLLLSLNAMLNCYCLMIWNID